MIKNPDPNRCRQEVPGEGQWGWFHTHQCQRKWVVERGGIQYCKIHDPIEMERRWKEKLERDHERFEKENLKRHREAIAIACHKEFLDVCKTLMQTWPIAKSTVLYDSATVEVRQLHDRFKAIIAKAESK